MRTRLGIDEAGRGCVLGPMVFGAYLVAEADEPGLRELGVRDSKKVSRKRRDLLRPQLEERALAWRTLALQPPDLDKRSLNELGKEAVVSLCRELKPDVLVLDAPVPPAGIPAYAAAIRSLLAEAGHPVDSLEIIAENGADDRYPCCAAASILAKTSRDAFLAALAEEQGEGIGSGYPSDPVTVGFLTRLWERDESWPPFVRTKWETARRIVAKSRQGRLF
ncbi:MAG: ribonuclease HII [Myxococcota bacterium]|nr:ribonuclease HII [Myxococcota bacterium]